MPSHDAECKAHSVSSQLICLEILTSDRVLLTMRDARIVLMQVNISEIWQGLVWSFVHVAQKVCC